MGGDSRWSKAIDADVARTFGRPTSFRGSGDGMDVRRERRRHWWPESLGGAPLGAMSPLEKHVCMCVLVDLCVVHACARSFCTCGYGAR